MNWLFAQLSFPLCYEPLPITRILGTFGSNTYF